MCGKKAENSADEAPPVVRKGALSPEPLALVFSSAKKKAAGLASGGMIKSSGNRERGKRRRESTARFAEIHLEVAEIDLGIALALVRRLLEHFGPASRVAVEPILAEPLVLALAVDAAIGVRQGV